MINFNDLLGDLLGGGGGGGGAYNALNRAVCRFKGNDYILGPRLKGGWRVLIARADYVAGVPAAPLIIAEELLLTGFEPGETLEEEGGDSVGILTIGNACDPVLDRLTKHLNGIHKGVALEDIPESPFGYPTLTQKARNLIHLDHIIEANKTRSPDGERVAAPLD